MKNTAALLVLLITILLFAGCVTREQDYTKFMKQSDVKVTAEDTFKNYNPCLAFECKNTTPWYKLLLHEITLGIYDPIPSLVGGSCKFSTYDPTVAKDVASLQDVLIGNSSFHLRTFMIGQGPSFAAADEAQRFCDGNLGFAIHDLGGSSSERPKTIDMEQLKCHLAKNTIPLLTYQVQLSSSSYTEELIGKLKGKGPVFVSPGTGYVKGGSAIADPTYEMCTMGSKTYGCENCMVVPIVKFNDTSTLSFYSEFHPAPLGGNPVGCIPMQDVVKAIGFTLNLSEMEKCDRYSVALAVQNFIGNISETWKKPSLMVVVNAKPGLNKAGTCTWTEEEIVATYEYLYSEIPIFVPSGLIGMGNADLAQLLNASGGQSQEFMAWFRNCQFYYNPQDVARTPMVPLVFPLGGDVQSSQCTSLNTMAMALLLKCNLNYSSLPPIEPVDMQQYCGDSCIDDAIFKESRLDTYKDRYDYLIDNNAGYTIDGYGKYCELWSQQIRQFSSTVDFDQSVLRAVVWKDSNLDSTKTLSSLPGGCPQCSPYGGTSNRLCCAASSLSSYYSRAKAFTASNSFDYPQFGKGYLEIYLALFGYYSGEGSFQSEMSKYKDYEDGKVGSFTARSDIEDILARASTLRSICRICDGDRYVKGALPAEWKGKVDFTLQKPLKNAFCTVSFGTAVGSYRLGGILLQDAKNETNVLASEGGTVREVAEGPRLLRYIVVEGARTLRYSNLQEITVHVGQSVNAQDVIGVVNESDSLRFEVCNDRSTACSDFDRGVKRSFIDPAKALGIECSYKACSWGSPTEPKKCQITSSPVKSGRCSIDDSACGGGFCAWRSSADCPGLYSEEDTTSHHHAGVDIVPTSSTGVYAAQDGKILRVVDDTNGPSGPYYIIIQGKDGCITKYLHLGKTYVTEGTNILSGDLIGAITGAGLSTHLHFEVCESDDPSKCSISTPEEDRPLVNPTDFPAVCPSTG
jgi:murein DD-endopeptidase MepM/ murein hydrolase activator NlpD